jgi:hypothetical protein
MDPNSTTFSAAGIARAAVFLRSRLIWNEWESGDLESVAGFQRGKPRLNSPFQETLAHR